jgi:hypothetical protein
MPGFYAGSDNRKYISFGPEDAPKKIDEIKVAEPSNLRNVLSGNSVIVSQQEYAKNNGLILVSWEADGTPVYAKAG